MSFDEFENVIAERDARIDQLEERVRRLIEACSLVVLYSLPPTDVSGNAEYERGCALFLKHGQEIKCKYQAAIERGGWDISPCSTCNEDVVCLPEGGALCIECAGKQDEQPAVLPERKT